MTDGKASVSQAIRQRHTLKVLANPDRPWPIANGDFSRNMTELVELAACAPFHYACDPQHHAGQLDSRAPWRFYLLESRNARSLLQRLSDFETPLGKVGAMLAAADGLILATWLPDPANDGSTEEMQSFTPTQRNMEHIAATAAAIQNLLLAATERDINNYWSSGGAVLRSEEFYRLIEIPLNQVLLGAIFLFPKDTKTADTKPGANRGKQGPTELFSRWVELD